MIVLLLLFELLLLFVLLLFHFSDAEINLSCDQFLVASDSWSMIVKPNISELR